MSFNFTSYKTMGTIYRIEETKFTAKGYPKRELILEIPKSVGMNAKTVLCKFLVLGDECGSLDYFEEGAFVELMFSLDGFEWTKPETGEKIVLDSKKIIDIHKRENPFLTGEKIDDRPDALSPSPVADLAKNVRDYANEESRQDTLFDPPEGDGLPF